MYDSVSEILGVTQAFYSNANFSAMKTRMETDYDLFRLKPYDAGKGYFSYTSNIARIIADKSLSLLTSAKLLIRVPEDALQEEERRVANNVERFIYGCLNFNDEETLYHPDQRTPRQLKAWYAILRGGWAERVYVYKGEDKETHPEIKVWDIYNVSYGTDSKGILWAAYTYQIPITEAKAEYGIEGGQNSYVNCIDFWDRQKNIIIVDDKIAYRNEHKLGYCPVFIFRVGATPIVKQNNYIYTDSHIGESIFAPNRNLFPLLNKTLSDLLTIVRRGVKVPMGYWSADGSKNIEQDIFQVEKAASVPFKTGEVFQPLITPTMPANSTELVNITVGEIQRGSYPYTTYGEVATRLSGYAINQLNAAMATVIEPFIESLEHSYLVDSLELVRQYSKSSLPSMKIRGRTSRNQAFGYPKAQTISPKDLDGEWYPEVKLELVLPKDDPQKIEMARMLREGETPLLSDQTIRSEILGVQDVDLEDALVTREWASKIDINRLFDAYTQYILEGDNVKAMNVLAKLKSLMMATNPQMPIAMRPSSGFSASTMPAESMGGTPPGAQNARMPSVPGEG